MNDSVQWTVEIQVESGPHQGLLATVSGTEIQIGRGPQNTVSLPDDHTVSERHARIYLRAGQWYAEDLGSRNGLFLVSSNGLERALDPFPLSTDSILALGGARLRIRLTRTIPGVSVLPESPTSPDVLHISLAEGKLHYRFSVSDPLSRQYSIDLPEALASGLGRQLERLAQRCNQGDLGGPTELRDLGLFLVQQMVPQRVLERLGALGRGPLLLSHDSELIDVPWELALAGDEPWCERFALGRQIVLGDLSRRIHARTGHAGLRMLVVADPRGDLPEARTEAEALLGSLEQYRTFLDVDFLGGSRATLSSVLRGLEGADLVYYIGHGSYDPARPGESGWQLSDGALGPDRVRNLARPPRFVFSNACNSAEEIPQEKARMGHSGNTGLASGLVLAGVEAVVGARWSIQVASSSALASTFFHKVLRGRTIGEALRDARTLVRRAHDERDLAWASFVLYGNPVQRLAPVAPDTPCK